MDLRELTEAEAQTLSRVTAWWKSNRDWLTRATIHRLDSDDPAVVAEVQVSADTRRFVAFAGQDSTSRQILPRPLRLTGLDPAARYRVHLVNPEDAARQSRGPNALKSQDLTLTGQTLMTRGILLPVAWPGTMFVVEGERV